MIFCYTCFRENDPDRDEEKGNDHDLHEVKENDHVRDEEKGTAHDRDLEKRLSDVFLLVPAKLSVNGVLSWR